MLSKCVKMRLRPALQRSPNPGLAGFVRGGKTVKNKERGREMKEEENGRDRREGRREGWFNLEEGCFLALKGMDASEFEVK